MSSKYENWKEDQIALLKYYPELGHVTKEDLYQEFKARLVEELLVDTPHLPQYAKLKDMTIK